MESVDQEVLVEAVIAVGALLSSVPVVNRIFSTYSASMWNYLWLVPLYLIMFLIVFLLIYNIISYLGGSAQEK
jgi:hypothetical protein